MSERIEIKPGIYEDVPFEDYCRWGAVNVSTLKQMRISPAHYLASWQGLLHKDSKPMRFGRLVHTGQLEPLTLAERYAVVPDYHLMPENVKKDGGPSKSKGTTYYKNKRAAFEQANENKEIVEHDDYQNMYRTVLAVSANERASGLLNQRGRYELSICWEDPNTQLLCKARIDKELAKDGGIADLKTTRDPEWFNWDLWKFGYHLQAAWYRKGWAIATGRAKEPFWLVAVGPGDSPVCTSLAAPVSGDLLHIGETEIIQLLGKVRGCMDEDNWPNIEQPEEWTGPDHKVQAALDAELMGSL